MLVRVSGERGVLALEGTMGISCSVPVVGPTVQLQDQPGPGSQDLTQRGLLALNLVLSAETGSEDDGAQGMGRRGCLSRRHHDHNHMPGAQR